MVTEHHGVDPRWDFVDRKFRETLPKQSATQSGNVKLAEWLLTRRVNGNAGTVMHGFKPVIDLRPVEAPAAATPGATVYVLLPRLAELVGRPGFGLIRPICVPGSEAFDAPRFFASVPERRAHLH